jgi:hypothetical protein
MEGKKEAKPSSKKLERNHTSESEFLSFPFVFFLTANRYGFAS